jgi:hypothetical protein
VGGCTNCTGKAGCDDHKGVMLGEVDATLARLYPTRTWGEVEDVFGAGLALDELSGLADELAGELAAATFVRPGDDDEACDFIYVLALGRAPCAIQVRDHGVAPPAEWADADGISELYLRLCVSQRAPVAAVQQIAIDVRRADDSGYVIRESPRAGVYDAPLLKRMQKLVAILPAYGLTHVDFGDIAHAPPGFVAGAWRERFGGDPAIANYLFFAQPATMIATTLVGRT